jgi:serine/threonine-protein kinase
LIGQTVGNYRVTSLLGEGGMGVVYQAEHPVIGRKVAIKVLHIALAKDPEVVARFFNEARAIHTVGHPNIVEILDFGQTPDGQPYFTMEFLGGEALNERIARGPLSPAEAADVADQICDALAAAHRKGVIHRDLKPHNVQVVGSSHGRLQIKLLDFGVAKILNAGLGDGSQSVKTRTGSLMGTPLYMSPEQCRGSGTIDHRTDIYSLGVMVYEMLAGRPPFVADGVGELFAKHMLESPPPLGDLIGGVPPAMTAAVMRALAKGLGDRFQSMDDFREALRASAAPEPAAYATGSGARSARNANFGATISAMQSSPGIPATTTLSSAAGAVDRRSRRSIGAAPAPARGGRGLVYGAIGVAVLGVLALVLVARKGKDDPAAKKTGPTTTTTTTGAGPTTPTPPATVTIRFEADPAGVHVIRETDGRDLGAVPLELKLPRDGGRPSYVFRLDGYKETTLATDLATDQTLHVALEKVPVAVEPAKTPTTPDKTPKPAHRHGTPRPAHGTASNGVPDDDGLATPSF